MKIMLCSYFAFPAVGGLWTYMLQLANGLQKKGHKVDVLVRHPVTLDCYLYQTANNVSRERLVDVFGGSIRTNLEVKYPTVDKWILEHEKNRYFFELGAGYFDLQRYDIIHAQDVVSSLSMSRIKHESTPLIVTIHGSLHTEWINSGLANHPQASRYGEYQEHYGATVARKTMVPSNWFKKFLHDKFDVPLDKLTVVHNGFDVEEYLTRLDAAQCRKPSDKIIIGCIARLAPGKGHNYLFEALRMLKQECENWECWLIGDGDLRETLQAECKRLGISDHVVFWGDQNDVTPLLANIDVFVLATLLESLSYATMEAQLAGKAVVVTNAGGTSEVVDHMETGLLSPVADSEALFGHIKTVMKDESLRKILGENARRVARTKWDLNRMIESVLSVYEEAIRSF